MATRKLTRRDALKLAAGSMAGLAVASCGGTPVPTATPVKVEVTKIVEKPVTQVVERPVEKIVEKQVTQIVEKVVTATPVPVPSATPVPPTKVPDQTGTLSVAYSLEPSSLDPHFWVNYREHDMVHLIFSPLWYDLPDGKYGPCLAESIKRLDARTWQFKLRKDVTFEDGTPFTAADVKYSWERSIDKNLAATLYSPKLMDLKGGDIIDDYTINMRTGSVLAEYQMLYRLTDFAIVPSKYYSTLSKENASKKPQGSGPFKLVDWKVGDRLVLEYKPDNWLYKVAKPTGLGGKPQFKQLVWRFIPEAAGRMAALEKGDVDIVEDIPLDQMSLLTGKVKGLVRPTDARVFIGINQAKPFLKDVRVRQALNYAVDWDKINRAFFLGQVSRLSSWVLPASANFNSNLKPYPYDLAKAKALLKEAGVPDGQKYTMSVVTTAPEWGMIAQAVSQDWFKLGLNVTVELMDRTIMTKKLTAKDITDFWLNHYGGGADEGSGALTTLQKDFALSAYSWDNSEWENIFASLSTEEYALDTQKRKEALFKLQDIAVQDPPVVYLCPMVRGYGLGPRVKSWEPRFDQLFLPWEVEMA